MTDKRSILVDLFGDVVKYVREEWDVENCVAPYYMHGHPLEILKLLTEKDKSNQFKYSKYPLIALLQDFQETKGNSSMISLSASPRVLILESTQMHFDAVDRYNEVFRPTLYPIYELFLQAIADSGFFNVAGEDEIPHNKTDRLFWGREGLYGNDKLIFNDKLDAIDISFINLEVLRNSQC